MPTNNFDQPIGEPVLDFVPGQLPDIEQLVGIYTIVEPLNVDRHFEDAYTFYGPDSPKEQWTYLPIDYFENKEDFRDYFEGMADSKDPYYLAILDKESHKVIGTFSLMRIDPKKRVVEMGWVLYGPELKHSRVATEAQYLVMRYVFDELHYRRYEWKCDSLNAPSNQAAKRLGFTFEGTFRRAAVYKNRSRDTNWYSMLEEEYQAMKAKFDNWLDPANFDDQGRQITSLKGVPAS